MTEENIELEVKSNVVVMHGREFHLEEPAVGIVVRILNVLGSLGVRSETLVQRAIKNPGNRAALFGLLAVVSENDLVKLGSAVLQFESDAKGRKWLKDNGVKVSPIVKALMINISLSDDLMEGLNNFLAGIDGLVGLFEKLNVSDVGEAEKEDGPES